MKGSNRRRSSRVPRLSADEKSSTPTRRSRSSAKEAMENTPMSTRKRSNVSNVSSSQERSPLPKKINISKEIMLRESKKVISGRLQKVDSYCWLCHKLGDELIHCTCCRGYHQECLKKNKIKSFEPAFCDCQRTIVDGRDENISWHLLDLKEMLTYATVEAFKEDSKDLRKKNQPAGNSKYHKLFKEWSYMPEHSALLKIVDYKILFDHIHNIAPPYESTGQFFSDVKWMYHNCYIVYGADSEITHAALALEKNFKQELMDIEACRECYRRKHSGLYIHADFFTNVCRNPHPIVWAKLRGCPYWPAKCLRVFKGHADVRFFGTHDKSIVLLSQVLKMSERPPAKDINKPKYKEAMTELSVYNSNYKNKFGILKYPEHATPFDEQSNSKTSSRRPRRGRSRHSTTRQTEQIANDRSISEGNATSSSEKVHEGINNSETSIEKDKTPEKRCSNKGADPEKSTPLLNVSVLHDDPVETKVHHKNLSADSNRKSLESAENCSEPTANVVCHMTFTTDEENCPNEMNVSDDFIQAASECSLPENQSEQILLPSVRVTADPSSKASSTGGLFPSNLPVITSTESTRSEFSSAVASFYDEKFSRSLSKIPGNYTNEYSIPSLSTGHEKLLNQMRDELSKASGINEEDREKAVEDDDDEDIKVIGESSRSGYSGNSWHKSNAILKNAAVTRSLCDLLLTNKPTVREHISTFQSMFMNAFLVMWVEINSERLQSNDIKSFQAIYEKLVKKVGSCEARIMELSNENSKLKLEVNQLRAEEDKKLSLRNDIIVATEKAVFQQKQNLVKGLEEKLKVTTESLKQSKEEGEILRTKLQDFEHKEIEMQKELKAYKSDMLNYLGRCKDYKNYESVECQTDFPIEKDIKRDNSIVPVSSQKRKEMPQFINNGFSNINEACSNTQVQQQMYTDVERSSVVLIQQSTLPSTSLGGPSVICERIMSECSVVSQTPRIQLTYQPIPSPPKQKSQSSLKNSNKKRKRDF